WISAPPPKRTGGQRRRQSCVSWRKLRVQGDSLLVETNCLIRGFLCELPMCRLRAQMVVVRIETAGGFSFGAFHFSFGHAGGDCASHAGGYLTLQLKDVLKCSVISVCP